MSKTKRQPKDSYDIYKSIRRDWGDVKPYTRVHDSKKNKKPKYKKDWREEE